MERIKQLLSRRELQANMHVGTGKKASSSYKRMANIQWIINLPRKDLSYQAKTKQLLMHVTRRGEKLLIRYPGKESARHADKARPWDFVPRLYKDGKYGEYMDFPALWVILADVMEPLIGKNKEIASILATIFYRMAFMDDHIIDSKPQYIETQYLSFVDANKDKVMEEKREQFEPYYRYYPNIDVLSALSDVIPDWGGMSLEGYLCYNELLAWNEDCKYYYRNQQREKKPWIGSTGRVNTLLTHISILGYLSGSMHFSTMLGKLVKQRGVGPANKDEILSICGSLIIEDQNKLFK